MSAEKGLNLTYKSTQYSAVQLDARTENKLTKAKWSRAGSVFPSEVHGKIYNLIWVKDAYWCTYASTNCSAIPSGIIDDVSVFLYLFVSRHRWSWPRRFNERAAVTARAHDASTSSPCANHTLVFVTLSSWVWRNTCELFTWLYYLAS